MERLRVHYWDNDGEPQVAIVEADDAEAAYESLEDVGRRGYVESCPSEADEPTSSDDTEE